MKINAEGTAAIYSTFIGPGVGRAIAVDSLGNAYVTGYASSADFPTTAGAFKTNFDAASGSANVFVAKLNPTGSDLVYSTYIGAGGALGTRVASLNS